MHFLKILNLIIINIKINYFIKVVILSLGIISQWLICCEVNAQDYIIDAKGNIISTQGNIHLGPLKIHPLFSVSESYDDNIFDMPGDEVSDLITTYSPGLSLSLPIRRLKAKADVTYLANFLEYRENPDQSHFDQYLNSSFEVVFPRGLNILLRNRFEETEQPPTFDNIFGELIQRTKRKTNDFLTTITLPQYFARFGTELYYSNFDNQYDVFEDSNYNEQTIGARLTYKLLTKLNTFTEFNTGKTLYDTDLISNSVFYESFAGVRFEETAKTTGNFKIGYRIRDYEDEDYEQFKGIVLSLESKTRLTALTNFSVLLRRSQEESLFTPNRNFYELNSLYLTLGKKLTNKIDTNISNYYQLLDFPAVREGESDIKEFTIGFMISVDYKIQRWLSTNLSYWYEDRSSSDDLGRKKNVITFTIGAAF